MSTAQERVAQVREQVAEEFSGHARYTERWIDILREGRPPIEPPDEDAATDRVLALVAGLFTRGQLRVLDRAECHAYQFGAESLRSLAETLAALRALAAKPISEGKDA